MNVEAERSRSLWMEVPAPRLGALDADADTDVLVIGAGVVGLTTAYELARGGRRVMVLDRGRFGRGMTARTTAHLSFELDDYFHELIKAFDVEHARQWYASQSAAVDLFERIAADEGIDSDFARLEGILTAAAAKDVDNLRKELAAARQAGFVDAEWLDAGAAPGVEHGAIRFPRQARFHPLKFMNGLVQALSRMGAAMHDETSVDSLDDSGGVVVAKTGSGRTVTARQALVATNAPFHLRVPIHTKQAPYRTYAIAAPAPKGSIPDVLLWDTVEPGYHYVRLQPGDTEDLLIVGGEDHKSGVEDDGPDRIARLERWARARYPQMGRLAYAWSGQVYEPADFVGFIGKSPEHQLVYVATGDSGQGMTTGAAAALILADLMNGRENPWASLYEPGRQMHRGLGEYVKENLEAARHWLEIVGPGERATAAKLAPGEGAVIKVAGKPVAAHRDETGRLHLRSAICTHAGCVVHWNGFEGCWDCPCHGSQFSVDGQVLNGPAAQPLAEASLDEQEQEAQAEGDAPDAPRPAL
jgi:glycine/D-amino acid oxidase-like deaminating enzyme/nitrite reductase/ring-hydroxylating ferredoxin subunit